MPCANQRQSRCPLRKLVRQYCKQKLVSILTNVQQCAKSDFGRSCRRKEAFKKDSLSLRQCLRKQNAEFAFFASPRRRLLQQTRPQRHGSHQLINIFTTFLLRYISGHINIYFQLDLFTIQGQKFVNQHEWRQTAACTRICAAHFVKVG